MATRRILVELIGDERSLQRSFSQGSKHAKQFDATLKSVTRSTGGFSRGFLSGAGALSSFGGALALTSGSFFAGAGLVAGLKASVGAASTFEQTMNVLQQQTGATADELARASEEAKQLGADLSLPATSASDAATAMLQLAKGGLTLNQAMAATRGTLQLAAAAQTDVATAANETARALTTFGLSGKSAGLIADLLANGAAAATGNISDFALALAQTGQTAHSFDLSATDTVTAITELAKAGRLGSDAGTSLRVMLSRLIPSSKAAQRQIKALHVSVTDASGSFLPFRDIIDQYSFALSKLNPKARQFALQTIFGTDAQQAANVILGGGVKLFDNLTVAVGKQGGAAAKAAAQQKGFKGALDGFNSALQTTEVTIGTALLPVLSKYLRSLATWLGTSEHQREIQQKVSKAVSDTTSVIKAIGGVIKTVDGITGGFVNTLKILLTIKVTSTVVGWAGSMGLFADNAKKANTEAGKLKKGLSGLTGFNPVTIGIVIGVTLSETKQVKEFRKFLQDNLSGGSHQHGGSAASKLNPFSSWPQILSAVKESVTNVASVIGVTQKGLDSLTKAEKLDRGFRNERLKPGAAFVVGRPKGLTHIGNIDINHRKVVRNKDGSISTEESMSINVDGQEILIPTVFDGKHHTQKEAIDHFFKTKQNLGSFSSVAAANAYAQRLHERQAKVFRLSVTTPKLTPGRGGGKTNTELATQRNTFFDNAVSRILSRGGLGTIKQQIAALNQASELITQRIATTKDITRKLNLEDQLLQLASQRKDLQQQQAQGFLDSLQFKVDKAGATATLKDDLRALKALQSAIEERIKVEGKTLDLQKQLFAVRQQIADAAQQQKDRAAFFALGLGPTGGERVPLAKTLRRQLANVSDAVEGSFLDTKKTQSVLAKIKKQLGTGIKGISSEVRSAIREMLDGINEELKKGGGQTKFKHLSASAIVNALGLNISGEDKRRLEQAFAQVGAGGTVPGKRSAAFAGAGADQTINVNVDGQTMATVVTKHQRKAQQRRTPSRRGPYPGRH